MDKDHDLSVKVDALLKRHAPAEDRNIPVLSELVHAPEWKPGSAQTPPPVQVLPEQTLQKLSQEIIQEVLHKIEGELAQRIESRLIESLAKHVGPVLNHVIADIRPEIVGMIGAAVNEALKDALARPED